MPEQPRTLRWRQAALRLEATLRELTGQAPARLDQATISSCYPTRRWAAAWRVSVAFSDGVTRRIDIVATAGFPTVPVRTALVDHPALLTWPHVESDGILCLLPNMAECDPDDPSAVAANLLHRSVRLIEELLEGAIVDRDFRAEFLTYWAYKAHAKGEKLYSLLQPVPPSRLVQVWRGEGLEVVGETAEVLAQWVRRRFGQDVDVKTEDAAFLWLGEPPLPSAYPETAADLHALATELGSDARAVIDQAAVGEPDHLVVVLGATGRGGVGLVGVKVPNPKYLKSTPRSTREPLSKGFRPGHTPKPVLLARFFGAGPVIRSSLQRADAMWVHGRGSDSRTERLLGATVVLIGCGSVGAPIACALAQAGIGRLILIDPETLSWPNVGRHPLGASAVGRHKSEALAERLQADFPHLRVERRVCDLHYVLANDPDLLETADLIVATTGSWAAENSLNRWHLAQGRGQPILYGWTEAHACAGHGVAITGEGGCLQCHIGRTGAPAFKVVDWPDGGDANQEEPACGAHYQPYGPVELNYVTAMLSELALDCLLTPPLQSLSRVLVTSAKRIVDLGGRLSEAWLSEYVEHHSGVRTVDRPWSKLHCTACGEARADEAA
jgi:hypothetical protein